MGHTKRGIVLNTFRKGHETAWLALDVMRNIKLDIKLKRTKQNKKKQKNALELH